MMKWIKWLGLGAVLLCLCLFIRATDFSAVSKLLSKIGLRFGYLLGVTFIAYAFGTLSWWYCLGNQRKSVSIYQLFAVRHIGETLSLVNPTSIVAGETAKVILLKNNGIERPVVIASVLIARLLLIISQLTLLTVVVIPFFYGKDLFLFNQFFVWAIAVTLLMVSICWLLYRQIINAKWMFNIKEKLSMVTIAWRQLTSYSRKATALAFLFALLHWIFGALEFYLIIRFLGFNVSLIRGVLVDLGVVLFKSAGAFVPGQVGIEEYGNKTMIAVIGIQSTTLWVAASILRRSRQLFWVIMGCCAWMLVQVTAKLTDKKRNGNFIYKS